MDDKVLTYQVDLYQSTFAGRFRYDCETNINMNSLQKHANIRDGCWSSKCEVNIKFKMYDQSNKPLPRQDVEYQMMCTVTILEFPKPSEKSEEQVIGGMPLTE